MTAEELEEAFEEELEFAAEELEAEEAGEKRHNVFVRLYRGETSFDFIGSRRWWFAVSAVIILLGIISLVHPGAQRGHRLQGRPVVAGRLAHPDRGPGHHGGRVGRASPSPTVVQLTNQVKHTKQIQVTADLNSKSAAAAGQAIEAKVKDALAKAADTTTQQRQLQRASAPPGEARSPRRPSRP